MAENEEKWGLKPPQSNIVQVEDGLGNKGLFINDVIQSGGTGGVSQKMTQDDRGVGGGLAKDDR